ncbi:MAG: Bax inhibitor-1/YccA family protein [Candidatus Poribacteria bacterium]|nr:Bax inhibitor-1/YccA family protein [Candidatus Poribacteria bacterium]
MRTANPALNDKTFADARVSPAETGTMTIAGTVNRTALLLLLVVAGAFWPWQLLSTYPQLSMVLGVFGLIGGVIPALVTIFKPTAAPLSAPFYAVFEGLFLGGISAVFEMMYPGIVPQAVGLTFGTLFALLMAYKSGMIKVTENFKLGVVAATGGIALVYLVSIVLNLFGVGVPYIHGNGIIGIGFSLFVVVIAALNLVLDFDFIENGAKQGAPLYMEWYAAFGLLVTLVWLYLEILRLLSKLRSRN